MSSGNLRFQAIVVNPSAIVLRSSSSGRRGQAIFVIIRPVKPCSGRRRSAVVVQQLFSGCHCQAVVGRSLSGHLCQVVVIRPVRPPSGLLRQAVVVRPSSSVGGRHVIDSKTVMSSVP